MNKVEIVKVAVRFVTMYGSGKIVNGIIANNVTTSNIFAKIGMKITSMIIGSVVSDFLGNYTDKSIDKVVKEFNSAGA